MSINIYNLHKNKRKKEKLREQSYKHVLKLCFRKIKLYSSKELMNCQFQIPNIIFGLPLYNKLQCGEYIYNKLISLGFKVNYIKPELLIISWQKIPNSHKPQPKIKKKSKQNINLYRDINDYIPNNDYQ